MTLYMFHDFVCFYVQCSENAINEITVAGVNKIDTCDGKGKTIIISVIQF